MKHYFLITIFTISFVFQSSNAIGQEKRERFPLSDAIEFSRADNQLKAKILKAYHENFDVWVDNKFIDATNIDFNLLANPEALGIYDSQSGGTGNPLGAPLIDALGTVIAKRFKEELTLAFLDNFRKKLKGPSSLGELFPKAKLVLLYDDPFNHKVWLSSFRGALDEDLRALPDNIPSLLKEIQSKANLDYDQYKVLELLIVSYSPVSELFKNPEKSYLSAVTLIENMRQIHFKNKNLYSGLVLMGILIKEMGNSKYDDWAEDSALVKLKNPAVAKVFMGLSIEKYRNMLEGEEVKKDKDEIVNLYKFLNDSYSNVINPISDYITSTIKNVEQVSETLNALRLLKETKNEEEEKLIYSDFLPLINQSIVSVSSLLDDSFLKSIGLEDNKVNSLQEVLEKMLISTKFISTLHENIDSKEYSKIVVNTLSFISENIPEEKLKTSAALREFTKYASFAVNLVGAQTSEEMTAAIESGILPVQSYRLKRNSTFSISVNSYAGIFFAKEILLNNNAKNERSNVIGFTAPIGVGFNIGFNKPKTENGLIVEKNNKLISSISLYASIIDVGAITTYRLTNDETPIEGIEWQNIFAPGLYLVFGIHNTPLTLSIGGQYGPELRTVTAIDGAATPTINSRAFRLGISLTVDIPFFHLYSKK